MNDSPQSGPAPATFSRRTAVKLGLVGAIGLAAGAGSTALVARLGRSTPPRHRFFSDAEAALLIEICEQIIPGDDAPGATETGAIHFIDRQLCGVLAQHRATYRRGLASFERTCQQMHHQAFAALTPAQKIGLLETLESGRAPKELWSEPNARAFFNLVLAHTMQSFYGSPRHGGNRNHASQRMLGIDYPAIAGQNRYPKA